MFISVVICTYNRADLLGDSIKAIQAQQYPASCYEIVIVDNNSTDETRTLTTSIASTSEVSIRYIFEPNQGLSFARNAGISNASGDIVAFVDDDINAEPGWLAAIAAAFEDANVMCAGGPIRPVWPGEKPGWLALDWEPYLTINEFEQARKKGYFTWPDTPWGANISFRKQAFETVGLFPTNLGRVGNSLLSNEEVNICKKIAAAGLRIAFAPEAVIHHKIPTQRVRKQWFYHRTYWQGRSDAILDLETGTNVHEGIHERLGRFARATESGDDFTARCLKKIVLGYLYQAFFAQEATDRHNNLNVFRTLIGYVDEQCKSSLSTRNNKTPDKDSLPQIGALAGKGILVVDYEVPQFDKYAGSRTTFLYLRLLSQLGMKVYFLPDDFEKREPYSSALEELGIEVLHGQWMRDNWRQWVADHAGQLQYIFFNRPNITVNYIDYIKENTRSIVIFQGHDLHYLRLSRKHAVDGNSETLREAEHFKRVEFDIIGKSDVVVTYSEYERSLIAAEFPDKPIHTVPLFFYDEFYEDAVSFNGRKDIMFVGGCGHKPNLDAILWFTKLILPRVQEKIPELVLHIVGPHPPAAVRELASDHIKIAGHLSDEDLEKLYQRVKMIVIPLRFGAGVKGKTIEAIHKGIPLVSTSIGLEGICDIQSIIQPADSEEAFAERVIELYRNDSRLTFASSLYRAFAKTKLHSRGATTALVNALLSVPVPVSAPVQSKAAPAGKHPRVIAFYLPQFHPISENDAWWGKGFTEWRNVAKAKPLFPGHYQPHIPADLGFYDLRLEEVRIAQAEMAREYGIHGFCYYHYWFNGKRLLETPLEDMLNSGKPDFPFCICWANENWTRRWDGEDQHVLIKQEYSEEDDRQHIRSLFRIFSDSRYIRIDGKPLFLVYRTENLPAPRRTAEIWREEARKAGIGELYLARVESIGQADPRGMNFDGAVEFAPDWSRKGSRLEPDPTLSPLIVKQSKLHEVYEKNRIHAYDSLVAGMTEKAVPEFTRFRCVTPSWDNSARRREGANIFVGSTPEKYQHWLETTLSYTAHNLRGDESIVFINAWNEWAEGNHLEPDQQNGRAYLEATRNALEGPSRAEVDLSAERLRTLEEKQRGHQWLLGEYEKALAKVQATLEERTASLKKAEKEALEKNQRVDELLKSASWRATAPLRWGLDQVHKVIKK